jgi:DNA end-binding protein Ku
MRPIWKGQLGFGLVSIPVAVYPAEGAESRVRFHLLDGRTMEPIRQKRVNERTGEEVETADIVKGMEYEPGRWVVLTEDEIATALPRSTGTIDIVSFIHEDEIDPTFFARPYFIEPTAPGRKPYALLREAMRRGGWIGIGRFVLRTRRYLTAIAPRGDALVMSLLRYAHELRDPAELALPSLDAVADEATDKELAMAEQLVAAMAEPWDPTRYADDYDDAIRAIVAEKAANGEVRAMETPAPAGEPGEVIDLMALLKRSVEGERDDAQRAEG